MSQIVSNPIFMVSSVHKLNLYGSGCVYFSGVKINISLNSVEVEMICLFYKTLGYLTFLDQLNTMKRILF